MSELKVEKPIEPGMTVWVSMMVKVTSVHVYEKIAAVCGEVKADGQVYNVQGVPISAITVKDK